MIINNLEKILQESQLEGNRSELARLCGVERSNISNIINGKQKPSFLLALKIVYYLNVPMEKIFRYIPDNSDK